MPPIKGVRMATARAGFYKHDRPDVLLMSFPKGAAVAGVFTRHGVGSAPVDWCQAALKTTGGVARGLVVNAGCANAFTGQPGAEAVQRTMDAVSTELGCRPEEVLMASTGVIGVVLQYGKILNVLQPTLENLDEDRWPAAAQAIMTTDTFAKGASVETKIGDTPVRISGIAKGSGMIAPDMATMLAFLATDAAIAPAALQALLSPLTVRTMNAVTVDGDRSTNDTCLLFATGAAGNPVVSDASDPRLTDFRVALEGVLLDLAQQLVRDGEGATKFVKVTINGADHRSLRPQDRPHCLRKPLGQDRHRWRRRQLGPDRHGCGPRRRAHPARKDRHPLRRPVGRPRRRGLAGLFRRGDERLHETP